MDLIVDEIENHFHKTLVENMISLYKDKSVNKNKAALIFTTHFMCEGPNELEIIKILLRHDCLKSTEDDLLGLVPYHARQIKSSGIAVR